MNKRVIFTADDFGITEGVNKGIFEIVDAGILTSTSVMSNFPYHQEIAGLKDKIGIGVHLNLTEGKPILDPEDIPTLVDERGYFFDYPILIKKAVFGKLSKKDVGAELDAQIRCLVDIGIKPSHIDSHESILKYPFFIPLSRKLAQKYNIKGVRTYSPRKFDYNRLANPKRILISILLYYQKLKWIKAGFHVTNKIDSLIEFGLDYNTAISKLKDIFQYLPDGILEIVVHPGYCNGDTKPLGRYVKEREVELKALLSEDFKKVLANSGVELINYNDIN